MPRETLAVKELHSSSRCHFAVTLRPSEAAKIRNPAAGAMGPEGFEPPTGSFEAFPALRQRPL
jgi:hypothetical protein